MSKALSTGGYVAAAILILFGAVSLVVGSVGRAYVRDQLAQEKIVGTPDMSPTGIKPGIIASGVKGIDIPSCTVANQPVDTGKEAKCFADYMRIHTLEATGGKTYAEMPQYATADGKGTNDPEKASKDASGAPESNGARNIWITETALTTALYMSFFSESVALWAFIIGVALVLVGIGFVVLTRTARRRTPPTTELA